MDLLIRSVGKTPRACGQDTAKTDPRVDARIGRPCAGLMYELHRPPLPVRMGLNVLKELAEALRRERMNRHDPTRFHCAHEPLQVCHVGMSRRVVGHHRNLVRLKEAQEPFLIHEFRVS